MGHLPRPDPKFGGSILKPGLKYEYVDIKSRIPSLHYLHHILHNLVISHVKKYELFSNIKIRRIFTSSLTGIQGNDIAAHPIVIHHRCLQRTTTSIRIVYRLLLVLPIREQMSGQTHVLLTGDDAELLMVRQLVVMMRLSVMMVMVEVVKMTRLLLMRSSPVSQVMCLM